MRARLAAAAAVLLPAVAGLTLAVAGPAEAAAGYPMPIARTFTAVVPATQSAADAHERAISVMVLEGLDDGLLCVERSHNEYQIELTGQWVSTVEAECFPTKTLA